MQKNKIDLLSLVSIAKEAGLVILNFYQKLKESDIETKGDLSPVTTADFAAHKLIEESLRKLYPSIPQLSEESDETVFEQRLQWDTYFLIDPLDGTKEFINGSDEFTVNIAVIKNHESVMGVVYQPIQDILYYGDLDQSFKETKDGKVRLPLSPYVEGKLRVVSSKSHKNQETEDYIKKLEETYEVEAFCFGSSIKICKVAEGIADLNPRLGGTSEWDIAAGHAVLRGAGGDIVLFASDKRVQYNKESLVNPWYEAKRAALLKPKA